MTVKADFTLRRFVGGICVEEERLDNMTIGLVRRLGRQRTWSLKSPAVRRDSVMQLVRLDTVAWGHRDETVVCAWRWQSGRVVKL